MYGGSYVCYQYTTVVQGRDDGGEAEQALLLPPNGLRQPPTAE
jgi:hypothetical protein